MVGQKTSGLIRLDVKSAETGSDPVEAEEKNVTFLGVDDGSSTSERQTTQTTSSTATKQLPPQLNLQMYNSAENLGAKDYPIFLNDP